TPAPWRSGYAAACKAVYTGSIPVGASPRVQVIVQRTPATEPGRHGEAVLVSKSTVSAVRINDRPTARSFSSDIPSAETIHSAEGVSRDQPEQLLARDCGRGISL